MPKQATVGVGETIKELTDADVTNITFQNVGNSPVMIMATAGAVAPGSVDGGLMYRPGQGEMNAALADLFPGVTDAARVWAWSEDMTQVTVGHA